MEDRSLRTRTKAYALRIIHLTQSLPNTPEGNVIRTQLVKAETSVGANYRASERAKSTADFIAKMGIVEEEADESVFWMELLVDCGMVKQPLVADLMKEGDEILAMTVASIKTAKIRNSKPR